MRNKTISLIIFVKCGSLFNMTKFLRQHKFSDIFSNIGDPRTDPWFLMGSPMIPISIIIIYLLVIYKIVPALMKNREPFKLTKIVMMYNLSHIILNSVLLIKGIRAIYMFWDKWDVFCHLPEEGTTLEVMNFIHCHHYYTVLKNYDLIETIMFTLRKKDKQVTFLHVFHHTYLVLFTWISCKHFPGGHLASLSLVNVFVHIVMYIYYFLSSAVNPKYLWWKKYVTVLQIAQHYIIFTLFLIPLLNPNCLYPKWLLTLNVVFMGMMIYLFTKFYWQNYNLNNKKQKK